MRTALALALVLTAGPIIAQTAARTPAQSATPILAQTAVRPTTQTAALQTPDAWQQYASPAEAGFSAEKLAAARVFADSVRSGAVMAAYRGIVVVAWGDVSRRIPAHSVRKSLVSALYGTGRASSHVRLDDTLAELGIDDDAGLTAAEKAATVRDIISARSGVYLPAAYAPSDQDATRPARGAHAPGTHWFYNNWDFNVAGVIYERATRTNLYEAFDSLIARPIGMEDYSPEDGHVVLEPGNSRHPAHTFEVSARDLARFGQLYLQNGRWRDQQVLPASWVRESTRAHSDFGNGTGYGYMWWTYAAGSLGDAYPQLDRHELYMARGTGGQAVYVIPAADLVIVHRGDTENGRAVRGFDVWQIAERILAAREGEPGSRPATSALTITPFSSQLPEAALPPFLTLDAAALARIEGSYELSPGTSIRVFLFEGRPFINVPGEGEAEMYAVSPVEFVLRVEPGVRIRFEEHPEGNVAGIVLRLGEREMRAPKR
jgi:CubicO group peptidase (beta-lactamase class C family)